MAKSRNKIRVDIERPVFKSDISDAAAYAGVKWGDGTTITGLRDTSAGGRVCIPHNSLHLLESNRVAASKMIKSRGNVVPFNGGFVNSLTGGELQSIFDDDRRYEMRQKYDDITEVTPASLERIHDQVARWLENPTEKIAFPVRRSYPIPELGVEVETRKWIGVEADAAKHAIEKHLFHQLSPVSDSDKVSLFNPELSAADVLTLGIGLAIDYELGQMKPSKSLMLVDEGDDRNPLDVDSSPVGAFSNGNGKVGRGLFLYTFVKKNTGDMKGIRTVFPEFGHNDRFNSANVIMEDMYPPTPEGIFYRFRVRRDGRLSAGTVPKKVADMYRDGTISEADYDAFIKDTGTKHMLRPDSHSQYLEWHRCGMDVLRALHSHKPGYTRG